MNCGVCGNACTAGHLCMSGTCTNFWGAGLRACSGTCTNTKTDSNLRRLCNGREWGLRREQGVHRGSVRG